MVFTYGIFGYALQLDYHVALHFLFLFLEILTFLDSFL